MRMESAKEKDCKFLMGWGIYRINGGREIQYNDGDGAWCWVGGGGDGGVGYIAYGK